MSDFPDPDEEFELMYGDDLELLREQNYDEDDEIDVGVTPKARKSIDFTTPSVKTTQPTVSQNPTTSLDDSFETSFQTLPSANAKTKEHFEDTPIEEPIPSSNSRKRTSEDLFGDIDDIIDDPITESQAKRHKANDKLKQDLDLIEFIVRKRTEFKTNHLSALGINANKKIDSGERDKRNLSASVPRYPFIKVKNFESENVYVRFHSEDYEREDSARILKEHSFQGVMGDSFKQIWGDAQQLLQIESINIEETTKSDTDVMETDSHEKQLWVDLYKPRRYLELLSDESTNRTILRWLKLWDKVVFKRNPKIKTDPGSDDKKKFFRFNELNTKLDEHGRPEHKVVLMCGPPGLGKTTLAHMVAKHAGYNVVEINASDDRSTEAFRTALENSTQMRSVVDDKKTFNPNCVVFDEIDGAPSASIDFLVKFITGTAPSRTKKKIKSKSNILKRPIICICNDVYVPALRPLRQIAFVVNFPQTSSARLAERLMDIARRQQIKTDMGAMMTLAEKSNNDIRSCLSVLHFYKAQNKPIGLTDIYKSNIGHKDMQKGLFTVWNDIFVIRRIKKDTGGSSVEPMKDRMQNILNTMSSFGDHERVAQGVYENFPKLNLKDKGYGGISIALDWFCFNDVIQKYIYTVQNYSLMSYLNYAFVVWHFVFATFQKPKLVYPYAAHEFRVKETRQKAIINEVKRGVSPSTCCYNAALPMILDVLPLLLRIISPPLRTVSFNLYTEEERTNLLRIASIMTDYNLNYIQERRADGVYEFNLEPNIKDLVIFDKESSDLKLITYPNRQLISREIDMEKMRRFDAIHSKQPSQVKTVNVTPKSKEQDKTVSDKDKPLPNHLQTLKAKTVNKAETVPKAAVKKDFFGRIIKTVESSPGKSSKMNLKNDILFQYKEGYSNAVKKRIKIRELKY